MSIVYNCALTVPQGLSHAHVVHCPTQNGGWLDRAALNEVTCSQTSRISCLTAKNPWVVGVGQAYTPRPCFWTRFKPSVRVLWKAEPW